MSEDKRKKSTGVRKKNKATPRSDSSTPEVLAGEIRAWIEEARAKVATTVNAALTTLNWRIGKRVNEEVLRGERAEYGAEVVVSLSRELSRDYGNGFSEKNLRHMMRFAEAFPDERIVSTLRRQLGWSHFKELIYLRKPLQREFYAEMCRVERWSVRTLRSRIDSMLYEQTARGRRSTAWHHPLRGKKTRTDRVAGIGPLGHPRSGISNRTAPAQRLGA